MSILGKFSDTWDRFTETLNTRGGTIALLFISTCGLFLGVLHVMHHGDSGPAAQVIVSTFSGFTGALLLALTQKDPLKNGNGGGGGSGGNTSSATVTTTVAKTEEIKP